MKTLTLNIGLQTNTGGNVPLHCAFSALLCRFQIKESRLAVSNTEKTLVIVCEPRFFGNSPDQIAKELHEVCAELDQDCIAIHDGEHGELIGPNAAKWGNFNPDFFINF